MNYQDKERVLQNILSGTKFINIEGKVYQIPSPSINLQAEANSVYQFVFNEAKLLGSYDKKSLQDSLISRGLFSLTDLEYLNSYQSKLEKIQRNLYYYIDNPVKFKQEKENLAILRKEYLRILGLVTKYEIYTAEGIASYARTLFILSRTISRNGKLIKYNKTLFEEIMREYQLQTYSSSQIRELARTSPWINMWIGLKNNGLIFDSGVSISVEQQQLLLWTRVYESTAEAQNPPEQRVLEDDDLFDGWMLCQREQSGKEDRMSQHDEVFIVAETDEDIARIENLNSPFAKNIKKQRLDSVYQKGQLKDTDLTDIRQNISMKFNEIERERHRGN